MRSFIIAPLLQFASTLRFKWLFFATAGLFVVTLLFPDPFPFADEILFGLATLVLSQWKKRKVPDDASGPDGSRRPGSPEVIDLPRDQVRREG